MHTSAVLDISVSYTQTPPNGTFYKLTYQVSGTNGYMIKRLKYNFYNVSVSYPVRMDTGYELGLILGVGPFVNAGRLSNS